MNKIKELRQKRAGLFEQAKAILAKGDTMSAEDQGQYEALMGEIDALKAQIDRLERAEQMEAEMAASLDQRADTDGISVDEAADKKAKEDKAFTNFLRVGMNDLNPEDKAIMQARFKRDPQAAQSTTTTAGGYLVPQGFYNTLTEAMLQFNGVRGAATILRTATGNDIPMPTVNETAVKGAILGENSNTSEQAVTFGQTVLGAYKYTSKIVLVSLELLQDSAFDLNAWIANALGQRIGRITADHFTTGTGSGQPNGIVTAATLGKTVPAVRPRASSTLT
jgi:HK97 family phage major capsid protein